MAAVGGMRRRAARSLGAAAGLLLLTVPGTGCVGYVMGWTDAEVERLRRIVAELEAKNASLVEEVIRLRGAASDSTARRVEASPQPAE